MKATIYSAQDYEIPAFKKNNQSKYELQFFKEALNLGNAEKITDSEAVCCFVTDQLDRAVLERLKQKGVKLVALRSAGFDHVDLQAAKELGLVVVRVPAYSPHAVAEFAIGLMLSVIRKIPRAHQRVQQHNFSLAGQLGFNLYGKTVGIVGTGHIGTVTAKILTGFDCKIIAHDPVRNKTCEALGVKYVELEDLLQQSDVISLHCPLNEKTKYLINENSIALMKDGIVLINTARGGLIKTLAVIDALHAEKIGALAIDVYEYEKGLFFQDHSSEIILDEQFNRLQAFPNVLITGHQAFFSKEAVENIIKITLENLDGFANNKVQNQVQIEAC